MGSEQVTNRYYNYTKLSDWEANNDRPKQGVSIPCYEGLRWWICPHPENKGLDSIQERYEAGYYIHMRFITVPYSVADDPEYWNH